MTRASLRIGALALLLFGVPNSDAQSKQCTELGIPVKIFEDLGLKTTAHNLSFDPVIAGQLTLENQTRKSLKQVNLRISYLDDDGNVLFAIPYVGRFGKPDAFGFNSFLATVWPSPLAPGARFTLDGTNLLSTRLIPKNALVTEAHVVFSDGSSISQMMATKPFGDPILSELPERFELDGSLQSLPDELRLSISIDTRGRVADVQFPAEARLDEDIRQKIRSQIVLWRFYPAVRESYASEASLNVLLRFYRADRPPVKPMCSTEYREKFFDKFTDVELRLDGPSRWSIWYGGYPAHGTFNGPEIRTLPAGHSIKTAKN